MCRFLPLLMIGLAACGTPSNPSPSSSPSSSPSASASPAKVAARTWTDAEVDALQACMAASGNPSAQLGASTGKVQLDTLRSVKAQLKAGDYELKLSAFGEQQAQIDALAKTGCVKK